MSLVPQPLKLQITGRIWTECVDDNAIRTTNNQHNNSNSNSHNNNNNHNHNDNDNNNNHHHNNNNTTNNQQQQRPRPRPRRRQQKLRQGFLLALLSPHPGFGLLVLRSVEKLQNCSLLRAFAKKCSDGTPLSFQGTIVGMNWVCCMAIFSLQSDEAAPTWHLQSQTAIGLSTMKQGPSIPFHTWPQCPTGPSPPLLEPRADLMKATKKMKKRVWKPPGRR